MQETQVKEIVRALLSLPSERVDEVYDFVLFLQHRYGQELDISDEWTDEDVSDLTSASLKYATETSQRKKHTVARSGDIKINEFIRENREEILRIAAMHGAHNVRVFGSVARGEADERSDVDFLIELEQGRSLFDLGGLLMDLQDLLGRDVDVVTEGGLRERIRDRVLREAVPI